LDPGHRTTADLVIEVISPGSAIYDRNTKADTYAALGVKRVCGWSDGNKKRRSKWRNPAPAGRYGDGELYAKGAQLKIKHDPGQ